MRGAATCRTGRAGAARVAAEYLGLGRGTGRWPFEAMLAENNGSGRGMALDFSCLPAARGVLAVATLTPSLLNCSFAVVADGKGALTRGVGWGEGAAGFGDCSARVELDDATVVETCGNCVPGPIACATTAAPVDVAEESATAGGALGRASDGWSGPDAAT